MARDKTMTPTTPTHGTPHPIAPWQLKLAQRVGGFEPGCYTVVVTVAPGTVEPTWCVMGGGKVENGRQ